MSPILGPLSLGHAFTVGTQVVSSSVFLLISVFSPLL